MSKSATLIAVSRADDNSYRALADISAIIAERHAVVIGGQMVQLLLAAYPTAGTIPRRTADADAGLTQLLAESGDIHDGLTALGYAAAPEGGNRYRRTLSNDAELVIDLLVEARQGRMGPVELGGKVFDSSPGLRVPLHEERISVDVTAFLIDGSELEFSTAVPTVEGAVILKALAYAARLAPRDAVDIHNLLKLAERHRDEIGTWRLDGGDLIGSRRDAARTLLNLARTARGPLLRNHLDGTALASLIRPLVRQ